MDYEKKYKDALEKLKPKMNDINDIIISREDFEEIFPELKESEGEKIRKEIINYFRCQSKDEPCRKTTHEKWIAWLEKQGDINRRIQEEIEKQTKQQWKTEKQDEQKPANKVEPKFHVGDWITDGYSNNKITDVLEDRYIVDTKFAKRSAIVFKFEHYYHLWTIQDAKDGDVLATDSWLYMFKYTNNKNLIQFHCNCPIKGKPYKWCALPDDSYLDIYVEANIHPATKKQHDLLFRKMKELGYEWDEVNKELKKIEPNPDIEMISPEESLGIDSETYNKIVDECIYGDQKSAWSEEDDKALGSILNDLKQGVIPDNDDIDWLKSLKDRVKPQWKPSEEHIRYLQAVVNDVHNIGSESCCIALRDLLEQLKKL